VHQHEEPCSPGLARRSRNVNKKRVFACDGIRQRRRAFGSSLWLDYPDPEKTKIGIEVHDSRRLRSWRMVSDISRGRKNLFCGGGSGSALNFGL